MKTKIEKKNTKGKELKGIIVSDKMQDTVVVEVTRYFKHPKYQKFVKLHKKYKAHDKGNTCKIGETVVIKETSPISKDKHFIVVK